MYNLNGSTMTLRYHNYFYHFHNLFYHFYPQFFDNIRNIHVNCLISNKVSQCVNFLSLKI
jgi:hypothetical protein